METDRQTDTTFQLDIRSFYTL